MSSTPTTNAPRRQSCDRCHSQKLRCTRAGAGSIPNSTGACTRCLRLGTQCIYSPSLPKGRPPTVYCPPPSSTPAPPPPPATPVTAPHATSGSGSGSGSGSDTGDDVDCDPALLELLNMDPSQWPPLPLEWDMSMANELDNMMTCEPTHYALPSALSISPSTVTSAPAGMRAAAASPSSAVYQLSQLITRLYPLHQSSSSLTQAATTSSASTQSQQKQPLLHAMAFKPVAAWLAHMSANAALPVPSPLHINPSPSIATDEMLHDTFSASHCLLAILDLLQGDMDFWDLTPQSAPAAFYFDPPPDASLSPPLQHSNPTRHVPAQFAPSSVPGSYFDLPVTSPSSRHNNPVVGHLVGHCYSLLLNVYIGPLDALQHDADLNRSTVDHMAQRSPLEAPSLIHLRLVMMVQLCYYLLSRLRQAVAQYSSPAVTGLENLSELDDQVWKRLTEVQKILHI